MSHAVAYPPQPRSPLIVIIGSTGTGKSDLAVELAARYDGEVINADAMQMYRGLPIVTNQLPAHERRGIPHHLMSHIELGMKPWVIGDFCRAAKRLVGEIRARGKLPIVVGGTTYYVKGLLVDDATIGDSKEDEEDEEDVLDGNRSPGFREDRDKALPELDGPTEELLARLREADPVMADKWNPTDRRKIRRSLEIFLRSGRRASDIYAEQQARKAPQPTESTAMAEDPLLFWVCAESDALKARLDRRVDKMLEAGLMEEVKMMDGVRRQAAAAGRPTDTSLGIWQSIGVKQFQPYLDALHQRNGQEGPSLEDVEKLKHAGLDDMKTATRHYAKDQTRFIKRNLLPGLLGRTSPQSSPATLPLESCPPETSPGGAQPAHHPRLFILDSTDPTQWVTSVADPAIAITRSVIRGDSLPSPLALSRLARDVLVDSAKAVAEKEATIHCYRECATCGVTCLTEHMWSVHLRGRPHRQATKKKAKRAFVKAEMQQDKRGGVVEPGLDLSVLQELIQVLDMSSACDGVS